MNTLEKIEKSTNNGDQNTESSTAMLESTISRVQMQKTLWILLKSNQKLPLAHDTSLSSKDPSVRERENKLCRKLIDSLFFENLGYREGAISNAHAKTFEWIFQRPRVDNEGHPAWSSFPDWLEGDSSTIYWITGKPGAGKSTLVKFVLGHAMMKTSLLKWASNSPMLILGYYFWNAGSKLQKSHEGLLRTFLHMALDTKPDLVPRVLLARWTMAQLFGDGFNAPDWTLEELLEAFRNLVFYSTHQLKLVLVIDGLDEFEGDHRQLVDLIYDINSEPHVKVCVSSRPWNVFCDAFARSPSLRVEKMTKKDISLYVQDHFNRSGGFLELQTRNTSGAARLLENIAEKAQGVFLWIKIVVATLINGLDDGDRLLDLQKSLNELPKDLSQLFEAIWDRIDPRYHEEASQMFQIVGAASIFLSGVSLLAMWLSDDQYSIQMSSNEAASVDQDSAIVGMKRRLSGRTKGLLEVMGDRVDYMHRTVQDWVMEAGKQQLFSMTGANFNPYLALLKGRTLQIAGYNTNKFSNCTEFWQAVSYVFEAASRVQPIEFSLPILCSVLDRADVEFTRLSLTKTSTGGYVLYSNEFSQTHTDDLPHWSTLQSTNKDSQIDAHSSAPETTYIGFVSQVPVIPYVRAKILQSPSLLTPRKAKLMNAAEMVPYEVGFINSVNQGRPFYCQLPSVGMKERLDLLRFLLSQGADSRRMKKNIQNRGYWSLASQSWSVEILRVIEESERRRRPKWLSRILHR